MAKWGTYPPDEQLRLKRDAAEELYEALDAVNISAVSLNPYTFKYGFVVEWAAIEKVMTALAKARGEAK